MGTALGPLHLLALDHALADHLVDGRLRSGCRDRLAVAVALAVVRDEVAIVVDVGMELLDSGEHLGRPPIIEDVHGDGQILLQNVEVLRRLEDVPVPEIPLDALRVLSQL